MATFFQTGTSSSDNTIGGPARILIAPITTPVPTTINDVIQVGTTNTAEVQTLTTTGTPTGGTLRLIVDGYGATAPIAYNAASSVVLSALQAIGVPAASATGGPLPTAVVITFVTGNNYPTLLVDTSGLTGGTNPSATVVETTPGAGQYVPKNGWVDLGATKNGIQIVRNNSEQTWDVDQIAADIKTFPTSWDQSVRTVLAESSLRNFAYTWETLQPALNSTTGEEVLNIGAPTTYAVRRLAVIFPKEDGKLRLHFFRRAQHTPQESSVNFQKNSEQVQLPVAWKCLADDTSSSVDDRFGFIINQR